MFNEVYFIPVLNNYVLHAPLHGITALVNKAAVKNLKDGTVLSMDDPLHDLQTALSIPPTIPAIRQGVT